MKSLMCCGLCSVLVAIGVAAQTYGQQNGPGTGPPSPGIALPAEQQASQGPTSGLSGPGAAPNPRAGATNRLVDQNAVPSVNVNPAPSPGALRSNPAPVQPLYENSAAVGGPPEAAIDAASVPATPPVINSAQRRGQLGVWLVGSEGPGVRIGRITNDSAAARAGLRIGDIILQVNGRGATSPDVIARFIRSIPIGQAATLTVLRDGQEQQVQIAMEPAREPYQVGYRADGDSTNGDLNARMTRLEKQLNVVTEELQQLRQEMSQFRGASVSPNGVGGPNTSGSTPAATTPEGAPLNGSTAAPSAGKTDQGAATPDGSPPSKPGAADDLFGPGASTPRQ
jgi:hypothetical protein